jgi:L-phenylalanine/L-methionine N-acetyltransferase
MDITIRHAEPDDYQAIHRILSGPQAIEGTLQLPLYSLEKRRRWLSEISEGDTVLVACVEDEVVGNLDLRTFPTLWRRRHIGEIGMAVRDDWQGRGVGTALMEAALDLAANWLNLTRLELTVYTDNATGVAFRSAKSSASGSSKSPQNTPLTSGVPSSPKTTRSFRTL